MSTTAFNGFIYVPQLPRDTVGAFVSSLIDAAGERVGYLFQIPKTGTLTKVFVRTGTVTTGGDVDVRIETIDTSGDPSGTLIDANASETLTLAGGDDDVWKTVTFSTSFAVTRGDFVALVLDRTTGSYNFVSVDTRWPGEFPHTALRTGGSWAHNTRSPVFMFEYSDSSHPVIPDVFPVDDANTNQNVNSTTTPDEVGLRFKFPFRVSIAGIRIVVTGGNGVVRLYDTDGSTVLASSDYDADLRIGSTDNYMLWLFASSVDLNANAFYRITIRPATASSTVVRRIDFDTVSFLDAMPGGQDWTWTEQTDDGGFTETATRRPIMGMILDGFLAGGGGIGSGLGRSSGGMQ